MIIALHGYTPTATKNIPPYRTWARLATSNMIYPAIAITLPAAMIGPLALILSDSSDVKRTVTKAAKFGGTVKSCAVVVLVYPRPVMMVGRKREKLCSECQHCRARGNIEHVFQGVKRMASGDDCVVSHKEVSGGRTRSAKRATSAVP